MSNTSANTSFTLEHIALQLPQPQQVDLMESIDAALNKWRVKCINTLVVNFFNLDEMSNDFSQRIMVLI